MVACIPGPAARQGRRPIVAAALGVVIVAFAAFATAADTPPPPEPTKACKAAQMKVAREQSALETAKAQLAKDTQGRDTCATKTSCARYDSSIATLQKRITRHEARVKNFQVTQEKNCRK